MLNIDPTTPPQKTPSEYLKKGVRRVEPVSPTAKTNTTFKDERNQDDSYQEEQRKTEEKFQVIDSKESKIMQEEKAKRGGMTPQEAFERMNKPYLRDRIIK